MTPLEPWAIPLAALIISIAALAYTILTSRHSATHVYAQQLERRVEHLERELEHALELVRTTKEENIDLLRRLFQATGGRRDIPT
jgi:hypothetical protein